MRIISYNVNGIRAAIKKGFLDWLKSNPADVVCLQELKAPQEKFPEAELLEAGYHSIWLGQKIPISFAGDILAQQRAWNIFILVYCFAASLIPKAKSSQHQLKKHR